MKIKKYAFCMAIAMITFAYSYMVYGGYRYLSAKFTSNPVAVESTSPPSLIESFACPVGDAAIVPEAELPPLPITHVDEDIDRSGPYYFVGDNLPKAFADLDYLDIQTHRYDEQSETLYNAIPIPPSGEYHTSRGYKFISISVGVSRLAFETEAIGGVSYRFIGKWNRFAESENDDYRGDFSGKLSKLKNGKIVASMDAEFVIGGC